MKSLEDWLRDLNAPPPGVSVPVTQAVIDEEMSLFQNAQGSLR